MFKFNIFNGAQWHKLARAELRGFGGFVFGIMLLSAIPLYIATTTIIERTKKPLVTIPKPKVPVIFNQAKAKLEQKAAETTKESEPENTDTTDDFRPDIPPEIRKSFISARNRLSTSVQNMPPPSNNEAPETALQENDLLPLPTDFDIDPIDITTPNFDTPIFTEISFDNNTENSTAETAQDPISAYINNQKLVDHISKSGHFFEVIDEIVTTETHAIITHSDLDFWVIDDENWFANGKTRPSPILKIQEFAKTHNLKPAIYLESTNIMDIDEHIQSWKSAGITVITTPEEL